MAYDYAFPAKVWNVLETVIDDELAHIYDGRAYAFSNPSPSFVFPYVIYQSQDGGGKSDDRVNQNGWQGSITFRSIDITKSGAMNKLLEFSEVIATCSGIFHKLGYSVSIQLNTPQPFPIEHTSDSVVYTMGMITLVRIYPD